MISSQDMILTLDGGGLTVSQIARGPRLFSIVSGSNPYTATPFYLNEDDGTRVTEGLDDVTADQKYLWELQGVTNVAAGEVVVGFPNIYGEGYYFIAPAVTPGELCDITPNVKRELIGVYTVKSGANVTDVYQRFQDVTTDADGCETRGDPYCVVAPNSCDTTREPEYYCIDGVCWEYYDGLEPAVFDAGPFASAGLCDAGCPVVAPTCTEADADNLPNDLLVTVTASAGLCGVECQPGDWSGAATITRIGVTNVWNFGSYEDPCPGVNMDITLQCVDDVFYLSWGGAAFQADCPGGSGDCQVAATSGTVSPFSLTFEMPVCCVCNATDPDATVTVVVTE